MEWNTCIYRGKQIFNEFSSTYPNVFYVDATSPPKSNFSKCGYLRLLIAYNVYITSQNSL